MVSKLEIGQLEKKIFGLEKSTERQPVKKTTTDCIVLLGGLPVESVNKKEQLKQKILQKYSQCGKIENIVLTTNEDNSKLTGFAYIDFIDEIAAFTAVTTMSEVKFDSKHTISAISYSFFNKIGSNEISENALVGNKNIEESKENLRNQLRNINDWKRNANYANLLSICDFKSQVKMLSQIDESSTEVGNLNLKHFGKTFTTFWSPKGTYLVAVKHNRFEIYVTKGSENLEFKLFRHFDSDSFFGFPIISPCERYIIVNNMNNMIVETTLYSIIADTNITSFSHVLSKNWEFAWSHCGNYFMHFRSNDELLIFESISGNLVTGKPLKLSNIYMVKWASSQLRNHDEPVIAVYCLPPDMLISTLNVYSVPSMTVLTSKTYANVSHCDIVWQCGNDCIDYIAILLRHFNKIKTVNLSKEELEMMDKNYDPYLDSENLIQNTKSKLVGVEYNLEIIKLSSKKRIGLMFTLEGIEDDHDYIEMSWEPLAGSHICLIFSHATYIYAINKQNNNGKLLRRYTNIDFEDTRYNTCVWSPFGRYLALVDNRITSKGYLCFIDSINGNILELTQTNNYIDSCQWDPFAKHLMAANLESPEKYDSSIIELQDTTLNLYTVAGRLHHIENLGVLGMISWRPRGKIPLSDKEIEEIRGSLRNYELEFSQDDKMKEQFNSQRAMNDIKSHLEEFFAWNEKFNSHNNWDMNLTFPDDYYEEKVSYKI